MWVMMEGVRDWSWSFNKILSQDHVVGGGAHVKKFCRARMSIPVKAADVMASEVEKLGRAASTEPARTLS